MKKIASIIIAAALLVSSVSASAYGAGSMADPLVTESYANEHYLAAIIERSASEVTKAIKEMKSGALTRAESIYNSAAVRIGADGYALTKSYEQSSLPAGVSAGLMSGASFILVSGSATLNVLKGEVINIASGTVVPNGSAVIAGQRYFCTEDTAAVYTLTSASVISVDGWHKFSEAGETMMNFTDVPRSQWYYGAVEFVFGKGLFQGTSATEFSPNLAMSRSMFVTVLYRLAGSPSVSGGNSFSDVSDSGTWYSAPVAWASKNGIVNGYEDGTFRPDQSITREQMALILYNYVKYAGASVSGVSQDKFASFPDSGSVSSWAKDAVVWATSLGIINGSDGKLLPQNTATRAQVAQIIKNCCEKVSGI